MKDQNANKNTLPFATTNPGKARELEQILGRPVAIVRLDVTEIQCKGFLEDDIAKVAAAKAEAAYHANSNSPVIVEDTAMCIDCLEGRPGPLVDQFTGSKPAREALCRSLPPCASRSATVYCTLAVFDGRTTQLRTGKAYGEIALTPRGQNGFGWDDIFIPDGESRTFAEMHQEEKNQVSARRKALLELKANPFVPAC